MKWKDAREQILADPDVRAYYDSLAPLYALIEQAVNRRTELNMSQKDLAARMNTTQSVVSRIERGAIENITVRTLNRMADALGCSISYELKPKTT
ncbi:MAG: helix-turn-helix transcriptional regulator [Clostridia bacterium]|nr:helix-turn-helix transcriptional regulator [Clostridia bacterium]